MSDQLQSNIENQIAVLMQEQQRVKSFINSNGFDVTTAPYVIAKEYRDSLKRHIALLRENLEY